MKLDERRTIWSWALYDWANSAFATTVMAGFFPLFFKQYWSAGADVNVSTARLGTANSVAGLIVALSAPILGAISDKGTNKKKFLTFFAFMGAVMTCSLSLVAQGHWPWAAALYAVGTIGYCGGNVFYDALITGVASAKKMDVVSALGYSLGYLGGGALFAVNVLMTLKPELFGLADAAAAVRVSFLTVGLWWAVFTVPLILFVREPRTSEPRAGLRMVRAGLSQLAGTFKGIRKNRMVFLFLLAYWFYIDGVDTIIRMAVDCGLSLGFDSNDLIVALLIVQFVGFPAALAYGYLGKRIGAKRGIFLAIAIYLAITIGGAFMQNERHFYALAIAIGLVQGGIQALSRSYYARIIPADRSAEYFGFYNMLGKFAAVLGPVLMGHIGLLVRQVSGSNNLGTRASIVSIALLFLVGGSLLCFVDPRENNGITSNHQTTGGEAL
ncbi:MAG: MFS transporter [Phycisphaerales bacterium]|nr:MAG: MFS transporter [Phycisphaerales bacterium]